MKRAVALLAALSLFGCYSQLRGESYLDAAFDRQGIVTIAILPVINKTEATMAHEPIIASTSRQLTRDKKFAVLPTAKVMGLLRMGGGGAAYAQVVRHLSMEQPVPDDVYAQIARGLEADALFIETVLSYHQLTEDGVGATSQGGTSTQQFPVSVVQVRGELWAARANTVVWRDVAMQRYYHDAVREGRGAIGPVVELATRQLLANFPVNTWNPVAPAPSSVPSPITSYVPFRTPADPQAQ